MTSLYRHFDADGRLLYVGITDDLGERESSHHSSPWYDSVDRIVSQDFPDRESALEAERQAIQKEKPAYNVHHKSDEPGRATRVVAVSLPPDLLAQAWRRADEEDRTLSGYLRQLIRKDARSSPEAPKLPL